MSPLPAAAVRAIAHRLIDDLMAAEIWLRDRQPVIAPPWLILTLDERDIITEALLTMRSWGGS